MYSYVVSYTSEYGIAEHAQEADAAVPAVEPEGARARDELPAQPLDALHQGPHGGTPMLFTRTLTVRQPLAYSPVSSLGSVSRLQDAIEDKLDPKNYPFLGGGAQRPSRVTPVSSARYGTHKSNITEALYSQSIVYCLLSACLRLKARDY